MKKYVKPELFYEGFELSQQIAACEFSLGTKDDDGITHNSTDKNTCGFWGPTAVGPMFILQDDNGGCTVPYEGYCYHGSTGGANIFNS